jgi:Tfp pilus assembly protein FimT
VQSAKICVNKYIKSFGFTLIELILVAVLILTIIALSTPLFRRTFSDFALRNESYNIAKLINYAQDRAILDRNNYKLAFSVEKGSYQMLEKNISAKKDESPYKRARGRFGRVYKLPKGALFRATRPEMVFYPDGHCDEIRLELFIGGQGYSITSKGFGNIVEVKEATYAK